MPDFENQGTAPLEDGAKEASTTLPVDIVETDEDKEWSSLGRAAFTDSSDWFTNSIRKESEKALSNFRSHHPAGSKYYSNYYDKRSRLFRPKTRSMVRGTEAAAAIAFFSTADAVNCRPFNDGNEKQKLAADIHMSILNHRLADTAEMYWFLTVLGAVQDASVTGVVISRQDWDYQSNITEVDGKPVEVIQKDTPRVELIPLENFRISPAAKWYDPVNTSPYVIELVPMYVHEIMEKMVQKKWNDTPIYRQLPKSILNSAAKQDWDTVRRTRSGERRIDVMDAASTVRDFDIVWVHRIIMRRDGEDFCYDMLGTEFMLSFEVEPLHQVYLHNMRPYAMGFTVLETHKLYPSSPVMLVDPLQEEANDICNLRIDNIRLALGKRYIVKRGRGVDTTSLLRNVPSSVTMASDPTDIKEMTTQDVTKSSYEEQDRINLDFDELAGRFSQSSIGTNRKLSETVGGMTMLQADANQIQEYQIRMIAETWLEPVMRQLVALESVYESDVELLTQVGEPLSQTPENVLKLLREKVRTSVDVGFNATNPEKRIQRLSLGINTMAAIFPQLVQQGDPREIAKEIFGALGYKDASRFLPSLKGDAEDPRVAQLTQQVQELQQQLETGMAVEDLRVKGRIRVAEISAEAKMAGDQIQAQVDAMKADAGNNVEYFLIQLEDRLKQIDRMIAVEDNDIHRRELYLQREALSAARIDADRDYQLRVAELHQKREADKDDVAVKAVKANGEGPGAKNLAGNDKAGVISRNDFGGIPGAGG